MADTGALTSFSVFSNTLNNGSNKSPGTLKYSRDYNITGHGDAKNEYFGHNAEGRIVITVSPPAMNDCYLDVGMIFTGYHVDQHGSLCLAFGAKNSAFGAGDSSILCACRVHHAEFYPAKPSTWDYHLVANDKKDGIDQWSYVIARRISLGKISAQTYSLTVGIDGDLQGGTKSHGGLEFQNKSYLSYNVALRFYDKVPATPSPKMINGAQKNIKKIISIAPYSFICKKSNTTTTAKGVLENNKMNISNRSWFYAYGKKGNTTFRGQMEFTDVLNNNVKNVHSNNSQNNGVSIISPMCSAGTLNGRKLTTSNPGRIINLQAAVEESWDMQWSGFSGTAAFYSDFFYNSPAFFPFYVRVSGNYRITGWIGCLESDINIPGASSAKSNGGIYYGGWIAMVLVKQNSIVLSAQGDGTITKVSNNSQPVWIRWGAQDIQSTVCAYLKPSVPYNDPYNGRKGVWNYLDRIIWLDGNTNYNLLFACSSNANAGSLTTTRGTYKYAVAGMTKMDLHFEKLPEDNVDASRSNSYRPDSWTDWVGSTFAHTNRTETFRWNNGQSELAPVT